MRKAVVIYDSRFGNTERIANALAEGMKEQGVKVDCIKVDKVDVSKLSEYDLLAIGGPTHMRGVSEPMKAFLEKLRSVDMKGKKAFAFDTKVQAWWAGSAGKGIEKGLKRLRMSIVKPRSSAIVTGREGPLKEGMKELFKQVGVEIQNQFNELLGVMMVWNNKKDYRPHLHMRTRRRKRKFYLSSPRRLSSII